MAKTKKARTRRVYVKSNRRHRRPRDSINVVQDILLAYAAASPATSLEGQPGGVTPLDTLAAVHYNPFATGESVGIGPYNGNMTPLESYYQAAKANWKQEAGAIAGAYIANFIGKTSFGRKLRVKIGKYNVRLF